MSHDLLLAHLDLQLSGIVSNFPGVAGLAFHDLTTNHSIAINADELFPTASTIKMHVLTQVLLRAERGELDLTTKMTIQPDQLVGGSGVLAHMTGPIELTLLDIATLMIIVSDNTATHICIDLAGMDATNALLREMGLAQTTVGRKMVDGDAIKRDDENIATPQELVDFLAMLYEGKPTPTVAKQVLEICKKPKDAPFTKALPPGTVFANKPGWVAGARCDAAIVYLPRRPYALAVMSKFGLCMPREQEQFLIDVATAIYEVMVVLDGSNMYGHHIAVYE